jgi:hypothetical protein
MKRLKEKNIVKYLEIQLVALKGLFVEVCYMLHVTVYVSINMLLSPSLYVYVSICLYVYM